MPKSATHAHSGSSGANRWPESRVPAGPVNEFPRMNGADRPAASLGRAFLAGTDEQHQPASGTMIPESGAATFTSFDSIIAFISFIRRGPAFRPPAKAALGRQVIVSSTMLLGPMLVVDLEIVVGLIASPRHWTVHRVPSDHCGIGMKIILC